MLSKPLGSSLPGLPCDSYGSSSVSGTSTTIYIGDAAVLYVLRGILSLVKSKFKVGSMFTSIYCSESIAKLLILPFLRSEAILSEPRSAEETRLPPELSI